MTHTHSLAEWFAFLLLGVSAAALVQLVVAFADAELAYFDARPALRTAGDRLLVEAVRAKDSVLNFPRDAAISLAALLLLLSAPPKGATS